MNLLAITSQAVSYLLRQVRLFFRNVALALKLRRRQTLLNEEEVERLDRLRNPSKYLGK
jgi:hypothetical protein